MAIVDQSGNQAWGYCADIGGFPEYLPRLIHVDVDSPRLLA